MCSPVTDGARISRAKRPPVIGSQRPNRLLDKIRMFTPVGSVTHTRPIDMGYSIPKNSTDDCIQSRGLTVEDGVGGLESVSVVIRSSTAFLHSRDLARSQMPPVTS